MLRRAALCLAKAAGLEFLAGIFGFARALDLVSPEVLAGFLNALGLALLVSQFGALSTPMGFGLAAICAALTQFLPSAPIPSSLVGLAVATAVGLAFNFDVPTLAMKAKDPMAFAGGLDALPQFQIPSIPTMDEFSLALPCAISIAFISLIETLLAARVVDDRKCEDLCSRPSQPRHQFRPLCLSLLFCLSSFVHLATPFLSRPSPSPGTILLVGSSTTRTASWSSPAETRRRRCPWTCRRRPSCPLQRATAPRSCWVALAARAWCLRRF